MTYVFLTIKCFYHRLAICGNSFASQIKKEVFMADLSVGTGLATGIDTASLIANLMNYERAPERVLTAKQNTINTKISAFTTILGKLSSLQTLAEGMNSPDTFMAKSAAVSDGTVATATTTSTALAGTHQIKITSLAQSQIQASGNYASSSDTSIFAAGSFTISSSKPGATPVTVTLDQFDLS